MNHDEIKEITNHLDSELLKVFETDNFKEWLTFSSKFHNYSLNNIALIKSQMPDAKAVAGYKAWQTKFKRHVKKGEKGIRILAPVPHSKETTEYAVDSNGNKLVNDDGSFQTTVKEIKYCSYRWTTVFDVSQTDGKPFPSLKAERLKGDIEEFERYFTALTNACPVPISFETIENGACGYYHASENRIALADGMSDLQTLKTLIHEIAHQKLHADIKEVDRHTAEVEAEAVAYTVCAYFGIDTSNYSFNYIAGWSGTREISALRASLDTIRKASSELIDAIESNLKVAC